jgi:S-adenosylmethionine decarboxylase
METLVLNDISFPLLFEGVEKKLEVKYKIPDDYTLAGLRDIDARDWSYLLNSFGCQILNTISNDTFVAYLLSESSLFVYKDKVLLKTCGTTRLLSCLPLLEQYARNAFEGEMIVEYALFTRRNYKYPEKQPAPHSCWEEEQAELMKHFPLGKEFVVGDKEGDHFYVYMQDNRPENEVVEPYSTVEIAMNDMDRTAMNHFYKGDNFVSEDVTLTDSGISKIIPEEAQIDSLMFNPFGFSLNAVLGKTYYTMHITPQKECSYVSYETNRDTRDYNFLGLSRKVIDTFKPEKYTMVMIHSNQVRAVSASDIFTVKNFRISPHLELNFYSYVSPPVNI